MREKEKISLNKKIYQKIKIMETMETYKDFCELTLTETRDHYILDISYDNKNYIPGEISNYLISTLKE